MKISEILKKYDTDKNTKHCYGKFYDRLFRSFDRNADLDIIEVGIYYGESLLAWREFFPNAYITGLDIEDIVKKKDKSIEYDISDIKDFNTAIEYVIVIDDGSHKLPDVLATIKNLQLKDGGVMVIEDLQRRKYLLRHIAKAVRKKYSLEYINLRSVRRRNDDFLIVLRNYGYF